MEFSERKSLSGLAADWRRWNRAERVLAVALAVVVTLTVIVHFTI